MKPKKNPKRDLNKNSGLYFVIGLVIIMVLTYVAFEWKTYDTPNYYSEAMNDFDEPLEELPPIIPFKTPPPPPPAAPSVIEVAKDEDPIEETFIESSESNEETTIIEVDDIPDIEDPVDLIVPFSIIEEVPIFPGCENEEDKRACFQKMMNKHIVKNFKYPEIEQEMGIQGKVNIMFEIKRDGSIGNVSMRGPNKNLEKEAARIIGKLPKMIPGKQRGNPVRVPFAIPITFKLSN